MHDTQPGVSIFHRRIPCAKLVPQYLTLKPLPWWLTYTFILFLYLSLQYGILTNEFDSPLKQAHRVDTMLNLGLDVDLNYVDSTVIQHIVAAGN
jgi:hypothetical protein